MPLKVNEFVIQAKIIEEESDQEDSDSNDGQIEISNSVKKEIIDECLAKMKELLEREKTRF